MAYQQRTSCTRCVGRAMPGTAALMAYLEDRFTYSRNLGIYSCRSVYGGTARSLHACGRAGDSGIPTTSGGAAITSLGNPVVQFLYKYSTQFGIVEQIYNRVMYDAYSPGGRYYGGVHPHRDHVHWAQTTTKASSLTYSQIVSIVSGGSTPIPTPAPTPIQLDEDDMIIKSTFKSQNMVFYRDLQAKTGTPKGDYRYWAVDTPASVRATIGTPSDAEWNAALDDFLAACLQLSVWPK